MTETELWRGYAETWSAPESDRSRRLLGQVAEHVCYRDPQAEVKGLDGLSSYMGGFQSTFPGHRFEIIEVIAHHGRSLARWRLLDAEGKVAWAGTSSAVHDQTGRLLEITGFFPVGSGEKAASG